MYVTRTVFVMSRRELFECKMTLLTYWCVFTHVNLILVFWYVVSLFNAISPNFRL